ncbi:GEMI7 protein, partial [Pomatostomus ruficeps]|nr:GEMI7 protein [Pomatostomus ruficeps]
MASPVPTPVRILRLPRGPDASGSRGFSSSARQNPQNPRNSRIPVESSGPAEQQRLRAALRERFLRLLALARGRRVRFGLRAGLSVLAEFGAADAEPERFQVDSLRTPLGVQRAALLRARDLLHFSF